MTMHLRVTCTGPVDMWALAEDRSTDPDDRGAFLDGDLEIVGHAHREGRAKRGLPCP